MTFKFCPLCTVPLIERAVQGEMRRVCSADCGFVHYDNPTPVVGAIVEHNGMVVMAYNRSWPPAMRNESPEECVIREVKEELDLDATQATLVGVYPFPQMNQVIIAYHVVATGTITLNEELDAYRHVPPHECKVWLSGTGLALRDWLRNKGIEPPVLEIPRPQVNRG